jgi:protein-S-isoprenylcysteine O-methyltransferase Ste14
MICHHSIKENFIPESKNGADGPSGPYIVNLSSPGAFFYRARLGVYIFFFLILWPLNQQYGPPLIDRIPISHIFGNLILKMEVLLCCLIYFGGTFLRMLGAAYIGGNKIWSPSLKTGDISDKGPFRFMRHPVYTGSILIILSLVPLCSPVGGGFILLSAGGFTLYLARYEEIQIRSLHRASHEIQEPQRRFLPDKGFYQFLILEGFSRVCKKWKETVSSEFYNLSFGTGFLAFSLTLSARYFWYGFAFSLVFFLLLILTGKTYSGAHPH